MSVATASLVLFGVFVLLLAFGMPISVGIVFSAIVTASFFLDWDQATFIVMQKMNGGVNSFSLIAVPLFIFAGNIMNNGGIAGRLIALAELMAGRIPGSLAQTNVLGNMLFGSLSGSAVAAAAAIGGTLNEMEKEEGYDPAFATSVNIASAPTGLLIPPTAAFIVYSAVAGGVSISALFIAGYVPGILMGLVTMVLAFLYARKHNYPVSQKVTPGVGLKTILDAIPSLMLIIVVVGGIVAGAFTATEGAGVAVLYCALLSLAYRSISWQDFKQVLQRTAATSGIILLLISASSAMAWVMAYTTIPRAISDAMLSVSDNRLVIFLMINIVLLLVGVFMDITPAILIFTPIFLPIATDLGMHPVHFGVMLVLNLCIGIMTPPVGSVLFVATGISGVSIEKVAVHLIPYFIALIALLLAVTYLPVLSTGLPTLMGLME